MSDLASSVISSNLVSCLPLMFWQMIFNVWLERNIFLLIISPTLIILGLFAARTSIGVTLGFPYVGLLSVGRVTFGPLYVELAPTSMTKTRRRKIMTERSKVCLLYE